MMPTPTANRADVGGQLVRPEAGTRIKVCGITQPAEVEVLAAQQVDFCGLWYGIPGGPRDLPFDAWRDLVAVTNATGTVTPVLVTFLKELDSIRHAVQGSDARWVQLHGYPTPGFVKSVKELGPDVRVIKVLHVRGGKLLEERLITGYEKAGVDVFIFDIVTEDGRVGSTGQTLDPDLIASFAAPLTTPFLLAGGISAGNRGDYHVVAANPSFLGIDVDTNARGADGMISADGVAALCRAWKEVRSGEPLH
jgi:phosphoribosylanthranilate isomerase